ncbi:MAG: helix-turn-helix domain-containing protein, partial [Bacteroidota bacterium]
MTSTIKNIHFQKKKDTRSFFDIVRFSDVLLRQPTDHCQFEHHKLTFFVLMFMTDGEGTHSINFKDYAFKRGTTFTIGADGIHKFHRCKANGYLLVFTKDFILQYLSQKNATKIFQLFNEQLVSPKQQLNSSHFTQLQSYIDAIKKEYFNIKDDFSQEVIRSLLHIIFTQLLRIKSSENEVFGQTRYLDRFLEFQSLVEQHCQQHKSVSYYADKLCITPRTLNNITNSIVYKSAKAVMDDILISKVKRLLINSDMNVTQIAFQTGFNDPSY